MLRRSTLSAAGLFRSSASLSTDRSSKAASGPHVIFMHVNSNIKGTYNESTAVRDQMRQYSEHYNTLHRFTDSFPKPSDKKIEESRKYCERNKSAYEAFMEGEALQIVQAIDEAAYFTGEQTGAYNKKHGLASPDLDNTIVQVQWPEHSFVVGSGVGPEGGAIPEEIFNKYILKPLSEKIIAWPKHIHMDASSMLVSVIDRSNSLFKNQFKNQYFYGGFGDDRPFIFNTSLFLNADKPITLTTKHTISVSNVTVGLRSNNLSRDVRLKHDQINPDNTQVRQIQLGEEYVVVQALCLDAQTPHNVPFRSAMNWSFKQNDYQTLQQLKGYTIISSDTIVFEALDGMTHLLFSQADSSKDRSAVVLLDHSDQRIKHFNSVSLDFSSNGNSYAAKSVRCFETVEMQPIRPALMRELQDLYL